MNIGFYIIIIFTLLFASFLALVSMIQTVDMNLDNDWKENIEFSYHFPIGNLILMLFSLGLFFFLYRYCKKQSTFIYQYKEIILDKLPHVLAFFIFVLGINWLYAAQTHPSHDSWYVMNAAQNFSRGDYSVLSLDTETYFHRYPFQLGYVLFTEIVIRSFRIIGEAENMLYLQCINVFMLAVAYFGLVNITKITFKNNAVTLFTSLLLFFCFQPVMFSTFLYGNTPGFMFVILSVYNALRFFEGYKIRHGAISAFCIGMAVLVKYNNMIALVALCIIILLNLLKEKLFKKNLRHALVSLGFFALSLAFGLGMSSFAVRQYGKRADVEMSKGAPMSAWLLMGVSEAYIAPGWYNAHPIGAYEQFNRNTSAAISVNMKEFKDRMGEFSQDLGYTANFFFRKFTSQWNESTYQSIWTNQVRSDQESKTGLAAYVCDDGEQSVKSFLNIYNIFIFTMFSAGLIFLIKYGKRKISFAFLPLIILGGFLFHTFFEAKSQYAIFYFVMMIPIAGYGLFNCVKLIEKMLIEEEKYYLMVTPKYYLQIPENKKYELQVLKKDFIQIIKENKKEEASQ